MMGENEVRTGPGRPPTLSTDGILEAAFDVVEQHGTLRLADLGTRLGVDTTAVYRHFRNREELVSAMADRFVLPLRERTPATSDWRADFIAELARLEALYRKNPAISTFLMSESRVGGRALEVLKDGIHILRRSGASDHATFVTFHAIEAAVFGSIAYDLIGGSEADEVRREHHKRLGEFDIDQLFPSPESLAEESSSTMWVLVEGALDWLESQPSQRVGEN